jgi:hypothetical protein
MTSSLAKPQIGQVIIDLVTIGELVIEMRPPERMNPCAV